MSPSYFSIKPLLIAILLLSSDCALAFAQHGISHSQYNSPSLLARGGRITNTKAAVSTRGTSFMMSSYSLRVRGGATGSTKLSESASASTNSSKNPNNGNKDETLDKTAHKALQSIQYCVKMCFFSVISNVIITFIDDDLFSKFFGHTTSLSWTDYADMFDSLSLLFFGGGLWRISQLYWKSFSNMEKRMTHDNLLELFRYMSWIWGIVAVNLGLVSVSMAASLPFHVGKGPLRFFFDKLGPKHLASAVGGILGIASLVILGDCRKTADKEVAAYTKKNDIQRQKRIQERNSNDQKFDLVRNAGYRAYCNQALCAGSFAAVAGMELIKWIVSLHRGNIVGHIFSASEFFTPFAITALLFTLNRALLRAAIAEVIGDTEKVTKDDEIYKELFVAQTGFYNEAAGTMRTATIFQLLPYVVSPAIPFMLKALEKMSPMLFAKVIEKFGIQV